MAFSQEFWIQMVMYAGSFGVIYGGITAKIKELEKKMDRHNCLMEDMAAAKKSIVSLEGQVERLEARVYLRNFEHGGAI